MTTQAQTLSKTIEKQIASANPSMMEKAIQWIRNNCIAGEGITITSKQRVSYPEVTGYYIPTLLSIGEREKAESFADWLTTIQKKDGSFGGGGDAESYVFDTGQVIRGWVSIIKQKPEIEKNLRAACDWIIATADPASGRLLTPQPGRAWNLGARGEVNEAIHIYVLSPMRWAGEILDEPKYLQFVNKSLDYYLKHTNTTDFTQPNCLSHFYAYIQEALMELGCESEAAKGMASAARFQQPSGAVPGYSNVNWVCSTGLAQLAQVWYMQGETKRADAAMSFLELIQNPSGGFFGSYGVGADYFPAEEISWAAKYTVEACQRQISSHFDQTVQIYENSIDISDGRVQAFINKLGDLNGKRVLDAGCGKGRYSVLLKKLYPSAEITAMDISAEMLKHIPANINKAQAGILQMPFEDNSFDAVICIEALEHVVRIDEGIQQLARVTAPGGTVLVIDKNVEKLGAIQMPSWEKWFSRTELIDEMTKAGLVANAEVVDYKGAGAPEGLFLCWTGKKAPKMRGVKVSKIETRKKLKIAYYGNCWMTNVGEAFIDIGAIELLKKAMPDSEVIFVTPMSRYYNNAMRMEAGSQVSQVQAYQSAAHLGKYIDADVFVMAGMFASEDFLRAGSASYWVDEFLASHPNMKVLFMGLGAQQYSERETAVFMNYIKEKVNLAGFISRDNKTFDSYRDKLPNCHAGIDCAFFVSDAYNPVGFASKDYVVSTFNNMPEPALVKSLGCDVIRPEHMFYGAKFDETIENIFISDAPHDYLSLYANAKEVHTDLVHATIVSLTYGTRVKYYHDSKRSYAFEAVGAVKDEEGFLYVPRETLQAKKEAFVEAVRKSLS